ncbi:MAG: transposase [Candidatus Humimicrobiaceae bacterium]
MIWCPKYRRPVLVGEIADRLDELLKQKAKELEIEIVASTVKLGLFVSSSITGKLVQVAHSLVGYILSI